MLIPQSTSKVVMFKAYLDTDHVTEATGKTIAITISKNGGAFGNPNAGATNATEVSGGWYKVTLDTTDTGTTGPLAVRGTNADIDDVGVLFEVFATLPVNVTHFGGSAGTFSSGRPEIIIQDDGITAAKIAANSIGSAEIADGAITAAKIATDAIDADALADGAITAATFAAGAIDNAAIAANAIGSAEIADGAITAAKIATDAIDADALAADAIAEINATVDTALADYDGPTHAELVSEINSVQSDIAGLNDLSAAEVNAEVGDALSTDTYAEPGQGAPGATISLADKIGFLYKAWRNRHTQTASEYALYADDGTTKDQEAAVSDNGTTFDRAEVTTGA